MTRFWLACATCLFLHAGFVPVAMAAYYLKGVAPEWDLTKIYRGMMEFIILQCVGLAIVVFFPKTALWLPSLVLA